MSSMRWKFGVVTRRGTYWLGITEKGCAPAGWNMWGRLAYFIERA